MNITQQVRDWCYAECERQHATTPADIEGMEGAWDFAQYMSAYPVSVGAIRDLARMVDPVANPGGSFRTGPAVFMDGGRAEPAYMISESLGKLLSFLNDEDPFNPGPSSTATPDEFYRELMYIHPFKDGNGRVGALVYNWLNGTLDNPIVPPEYK